MPATTANASGNNRQQQNAGGTWGSVIFRLLFMYFLFNFFFKKPANTAAPVTDSNGKPLPGHFNIWNPGQSFELRVYLSEEQTLADFNDQDSLVWHEKDLAYDWNDKNTREYFLEFETPKSLQNNQSYYAHIFIAKTGFPLDPSDPEYSHTAVIRTTHALNKYMPHKRVFRKNLLSGESNEPSSATLNENSTQITEYLNFWKPNLTLHLIDDHSRYSRGGIPQQIEAFLQFDSETGGYYPVLFVDEFWLLKEHLIIVNDTVKTIPLSLSYSPFSLMKWQMMLQMEQSFSMQQSMGTAAEGDSDEFKRMLVETNPYLLALTFVVTILHTVFDFLAFKNDITFWKNKKNLEGMSVRTIFVNTACQFIIFLYLLDNETSWIIIISSGVGLLIEGWKIKKAVIVEVDWTKRFPLTYRDRDSYASKTKEYDEQAMKYLSYALYPLVFGYSIYSLMYDTHKSWYSWILSSLTGCVYTFGFIMMCPQLFINYKLKSVAHLPWRTFTYKALNTFIDDLFAFIIKMPIMHRLSCFRDDVIFLIYLYQRWIYRVDMTRVNEFGQGGPETDDTAVTTTATTQPNNKKTN